MRQSLPSPNRGGVGGEVAYYKYSREHDIISRKALLEFSEIHADAEAPLDTWYRVAKSANWKNIMDVKEVRPDADFVDGYTVFNIKGNDYRLITEINYRSQTIFIRYIFTHTEYDEGKWKK